MQMLFYTSFLVISFLGIKAGRKLIIYIDKRGYTSF